VFRAIFAILLSQIILFRGLPAFSFL
jgi:hypothetical protein